MGEKTRNREILNILHSNNKEQIVNFFKEKELIQTTPPLCANKNCKGFGTKQMSFSPRKSHKDQIYISRLDYTRKKVKNYR